MGLFADETSHQMHKREQFEVKALQGDPKQIEIVLSKERTILAKQRNYLAHINTGLASMALGFGILRAFEASARQLLANVGLVFIGLGICAVAYGTWKVILCNRGLQAIKKHRGHLFKMYVKESIASEDTEE